MPLSLQMLRNLEVQMLWTLWNLKVQMLWTLKVQMLFCLEVQMLWSLELLLSLGLLEMLVSLKMLSHLEVLMSLGLLWYLEMVLFLQMLSLPPWRASPEEQVQKVIDRFAQKMEGTRQKRRRPDVLEQACIVLHYEQCKNYRATARMFHLSSNSGVKQVSGYVKKKGHHHGTTGGAWKGTKGVAKPKICEWERTPCPAQRPGERRC